MRLLSVLLLEICVASLDDCEAASRGGADRLELNAALALGGLTPSLGLLIEARQAVTLPIIAMLRPRPGGFCYSAGEFCTLQRDLDLLLEHGADGIAFGILHADGTIDCARCRQVVEQVDGRAQTVFHRAFDVTPAPDEALEMLIDLGIGRVMTSGQEATAYNGAPTIARLLDRARGRIEVLPAGGINRFTLADVLARTGADQVHASLSARRRDPSPAARPQVVFAGPPLPEEHYTATDAEAVAALRRMLNRWNAATPQGRSE